MNIQEALTALDKDDNDHWTTAGLPAVDAVKEATGDDTLTRALITEAAPLFTRENPVLEIENPVPEKASEPNTDLDKSDQAPEQPDDDAPAAEVVSGETELEAFRRRASENEQGRNHPDILKAQEAVAELEGVKAEFEKEVKKRNDHLAAMIQKHAPLQNTPRNNQLAIMNHIQAQGEQRADRYRNGAKVRELMGAVQKAPIDQVAQRKLGHGLTRQVVPSMAGST